MRKSLLPLLFALMAVLAFAACHKGGDSEPVASSSPDTTTNPNTTPDTTTNPTTTTPAAAVQVLTGVFIDAPVEGLTFVSGSQTGKTDSAGAFKYEAGGTVQFKLGNVVLGQIPGKALITPVDLVKPFNPAADAADPRVLQIVQFLMTVDANSNVVSAPTMSMSSFAAANAATVPPVDLSSATMDQAALTTLLASIVPAKTLVTPAAAATHLQAALAALTGPKAGVFAALDSVANPTIGLRLSVTPNAVGNGFDVGGVAVSIDGSTWNIGGTLLLTGSLQATGGGNGTPAPPDMTITGSVASATQLIASVSFANNARPAKSFTLEQAVAPAALVQGKFGLPADAGVPPVAGDLVHVMADMTVKADGTVSAHVVRGQVTGVVALAAIYSSHFAGLSGIVTSTGDIIAMGGTPGNGEALNLNGKTLTTVSAVTFMTGTVAADGLTASIAMTAQDLNLAGPAATALNFAQTTNPLVGVYQGTHSDTAPGLPSAFTFGVNNDNSVHGFTMFLRQRVAGIQQSPFLLDGDVSVAGVLGLGGAPLPVGGLNPGLVLTDQEGLTNLTPGTFAGTINSIAGVTSGGWQTGPGVFLTGTFTGNLLP